MPFVLSLSPSSSTPYIVEFELESVPRGSYIRFEWNQRQAVLYRPGPEDIDYLISLNSRVFGPKYKRGEVPEFFVYYPYSTHLGCGLSDSSTTSYFSEERGWWDECHQGFWDFTGRNIPGVHMPEDGTLPDLIRVEDYIVMNGGVLRFAE